MTTVFFYIVVFLLFGVGVFLVAGTIKGLKPLIDPPITWHSCYPYWFLKKLGKKAIYYFHIVIGIVFIVGALYLLYYVHTF